MEDAYEDKLKRTREKIKRSQTEKANMILPKAEAKRLNKSYTQEVKIGGNY